MWLAVSHVVNGHYKLKTPNVLIFPILETFQFLRPYTLKIVGIGIKNDQHTKYNLIFQEHLNDDLFSVLQVLQKLNKQWYLCTFK